MGTDLVTLLSCASLRARGPIRPSFRSLAYPSEL